MSTATISDTLPGTPPATPSSREEIVGALSRITALDGLTREEYEWIADHGVERQAAPGQILFREGDPVQSMAVLLAGEIHVRREFGPLPVFIGRSGQITGVVPYSRMRTYGGTGYAVGEMRVLLIDTSLFDAMLAAIPSMAQRSVSILLDRVREVTRIEQQTEKLNALGKLAGNLAHELNNPASAAQRAASGLLTELRTYGKQKYELGAICLAQAEMAEVRAWQQEMQNRAASSEPVDVAAREDALSAWFQQNGMARKSWTSTPELSECGVEPADLDRLRSVVSERGMEVVIRQFASSLRAERMTEAMVDATARIFDLIEAIKAYSFMDQAAIQEVDIPQGIENTLAMLQARLNGIEIEREYAADLPEIAAYGSELNQVWMALLENAIDAVEEREAADGKITIKVQVSGVLMLVEIWDNGPGIPPDMRDRIFEPFFTTKAPGRGLGLGLDTAQRIVRKHRGFVSVETRPGATCFQVRLPVDPLQAY